MLLAKVNFINKSNVSVRYNRDTSIESLLTSLRLPKLFCCWCFVKYRSIAIDKLQDGD